MMQEHHLGWYIGWSILEALYCVFSTNDVDSCVPATQHLLGFWNTAALKHGYFIIILPVLPLPISPAGSLNAA